MTEKETVSTRKKGSQKKGTKSREPLGSPLRGISVLLRSNSLRSDMYFKPVVLCQRINFEVNYVCVSRDTYEGR